MVMLESPTPGSVDDNAVATQQLDSLRDTPDEGSPSDTPTQTSPEAGDRSGIGSDKDKDKDTDADNDNDNDNGHTAGATTRLAAPTQKRRRVTRACDECRRKKIKCDGKHACTHCTVYSYECTYDQPSNRRRNVAPQVEKRLKRMEALLHIVLPDVDLDDPTLEDGFLRGTRPFNQNVVVTNSVGAAAPTPQRPMPTLEGANNDQLESMVKSTGQLDLDEEGYWDYHGHSSGLSFMRRMKEQFPYMIVADPEQASSFVKARPFSQVFESPPNFEHPRSNVELPMEGNTPVVGTDLPSREDARELVEMAMNDAASLLRAVHEPSVWKSFERIYVAQPENYTHEDKMFLPLLYSMLALGSLFAKDGRELDAKGYEKAMDQGFFYFNASRQLIDIADCRDLKALQAVVFMILFLQSSAKLSTCYSYIGIALRSALRMGLHRNFDANFNPIERETRKRVFWVIRKMDTYVGALLGLPHTMSDDDIDQELPVEVDDDYITGTGILPMPEGDISVIAASNAHTKLVSIIAKIVKYVYPLKGSQQNGPSKSVKSYSVGYAKIREIERDLQEWMQKLPMGLRPGGDAPKIIIRVQQLLRMAYAHAQMMLYRPFLHYVSHTCKSRVIDKRSYACAAACVSVSRNIIHITSEMKKRGLLCGAYWFSMYTTFFAILSLVFFALENPDNQTSRDVLRDAKEGKETLSELAKRSIAADRCTSTLNLLFEQLPERLKRSRKESISLKKRRQEASPFQESSLLLPDTSTDDSAITAFKLKDVPPRLSRASTYTHSNTRDTKHIFPYRGAMGRDAPFAFPQTPQLMESTPGLTAASASTPSLPFSLSPRNSTHAATVNGGSFAGIPLTPTVVTSFNDPNLPLPDLSSMMFPSGDPFAYPNQPMSLGLNSGDDFDRNELGFFGMGADSEGADGVNGLANADATANGSGYPNGADAGMRNGFVPPSSTFLPRNTSNSDIDVQLFGPVPMYQMQGMRNTFGGGGGGRYGGGTDYLDPFAGGLGGGEGVGNEEDLLRQSGAGGGAEQSSGGGGIAGMNLDELFGREDWAAMFAEGGLQGGGNGGVGL